jgi:predicted transcriptional regulator
MVSEIVSAYVSNNDVPTTELSELIKSVHDALRHVDKKSPEALEPAVPVKRSVRPDYIICLEDGKKLKMLKRHLKPSYNLYPQEYRKKWGLPDSYPMVAPDYGAQRSELAKKIGLGKSAKGRGLSRANQRHSGPFWSRLNAGSSRLGNDFGTQFGNASCVIHEQITRNADRTAPAWAGAFFA